MWRLAVSELANKSVYKDQELSFINSIKAQVKTAYVHGQEVPSAFFDGNTKPIFRSESARYVIFIQMSKEMWDFDTDGTGEIMFQRVINGFLPELFLRWENKGARHLVSIILFTRMEYDPVSGISLDSYSKLHHTNDHLRSQDFYRVLVSDMTSGQWGIILAELKREFRVFLRDVTIRSAILKDGVPLNNRKSDHPMDSSYENINGRPTVASRGNILEAINLASSQFSGDYIDRDLVRTGLSIIVITPGTGVFEVDYEMFTLTTETLIESGIGIDLVCLSRMPLHSVPLFKYQQPKSSKYHHDPSSQVSTFVDAPDSLNKYVGNRDSSQPSSLSTFAHSPRQYPMARGRESQGIWHYGIPLWADVSFWTPIPSKQRNRYLGRKHGYKTGSSALGRNPFVPKVRMYELQMMGIMENEMSNISIPYLHTIPTQRSAKTDCGDIETIDPQALDTGSSAFTKTRAAVKTESTNENSKSEGMLLYTDEHDALLFKSPSQRRNIMNNTKMRISTMPTLGRFPSIGTGTPIHNMSPRNGINSRSGGEQSASSLGSRNYQITPASIGTSVSNKPFGGRKTKAKAAILSRQISFGLRGFGGAAPKAIPVIELSSENAQSASLLARGLRPQPPTARRKPAVVSPPSEATDRYLSPVSRKEHARQAILQSSRFDNHESAKPIEIRTMNKLVASHENFGPVAQLGQQRLDCLQDSLQEATNDASNQQTPMIISPQNAMVPWVTVMNPSNPRKPPIDSPRHLGRWQHVFPHPTRTSKIKWKSLCSPASVPLTTEEFLSADQLNAEYEESNYQVAPDRDNEIPEEESSRTWLMRELINARLAHGFQIVVGHRVESSGNLSTNDFGIFSDEFLGKASVTISMSMGSFIHQLHPIDESVIEIRQYTRRTRVADEQESASILYQPTVRTALSQQYIPLEFKITSRREPLDWQRFDNFIARREEQHLEQYPGSLHHWRARFVLIPVDQPSSSRRPLHRSNEDNEEEIRLEGIRKLTQIWQRHRYIPPSERRFQSSSMRKDTNPLEIIYRTRSPSAVVAAELDNTLITGADSSEGKQSQLLPESELFERANLNLSSLAYAIQSDRGVKLKDRWWHIRLHYNCFIGIELTTWLLNNFKDVDSRKEAVDLGMELFKSGLFQHVEQRHVFRDGNYFYRIASEYSTLRAESRSSWFGSRRSDQSVPSTPINEYMKSITTGVRSRSSSQGEDTSEGNALSPAGKRKIGVVLSKQLIYDVDHKNKSYRSELINLHYHRIVSADDCYHLRIDWLNVTPKLIEDSIVNWATSAERFGLRLVELPIGEVSRINEVHPFRAPYLIRLAKQPPERQPPTYFDASSFTPQATAGHTYQKAILKKFNFVLDLEAAKDFPPSVDVTYSWGKLDYRYPQYISREGVVLAQVTDEGNFLLLANRLYNNRSAAAKDVVKTTDHHKQTTGAQSSPARVGGNLHGMSPRVSPCASPMIRATPDVGPEFARSELTTPEKIVNELELFCSDTQALDGFYVEVLNQGTSPGPNSPIVEGNTSPFGLPPQLNLRRDSPSPNSEGFGSGGEVKGHT